MLSIDATAIVASVLGFGISKFLANYPVLPALVISAAWIYAGRKYLVEGNAVAAFLWQGIGVLFLIALCVNLVLAEKRSWLNLAVALGAIGVEIWTIKGWWQRENLGGPSGTNRT